MTVFDKLSGIMDVCTQRVGAIYTMGRNAALACADDGGSEGDVNSHWANIGQTLQRQYSDWTNRDHRALERGFMFTLREKGIPHTPHGVNPEHYATAKAENPMTPFKRTGPYTFIVSNERGAVTARFDETWENSEYYGKLHLNFTKRGGALSIGRVITSGAETPLDKFYAVEYAFAFLNESLA